VARECCRTLAKALRVPVSQVLPASTGVIGVDLDAGLVTSQIPALLDRLSPALLPDVADAIMTTDTVPKMVARELELAGGVVRIAGITKGSGMIHPNMATTLAFVMTDAMLSPAECFEALVPAVECSYHRLSVDCDTSTNDLVALLANGASGVQATRRERRLFQETLNSVLTELAAKIARDGEGARKLITIEVAGASNDGSAARIARSIANSPLVKTAIAGEDANWGRILAAAGYAGIPFDPSKVDIWLQGVRVCRSGLAAEFDEQEMAKRLAASECLIRLVIRGDGPGEARFWTCDLTEGYVHINADYRT
jgi:glutamate N-acetyltransferase/amino-acid N-acetyltransferase